MPAKRPHPCPRCASARTDPRAPCVTCGYRVRDGNAAKPSAEDPYASATLRERVESILFPDYEVGRVAWTGRVVIAVVLAAWGARFLVRGIDAEGLGTSVLHPVHLAFHEAGHLVFMIFGRFMGILGGTLGQLLMPLVCILVLLLKTRDAFGASVATWWLGQSFLDCAPYVADARAQRLMLVSGMTGRESGGHDWNNILIDLGVAMQDQAIAKGFFAVGALVMVASVAWGGAVLYRQHRTLRGGG